MDGVKVHTGTSVAPRIRWIAPSIDGVAHAFPASGHGDAACGALRVDERFAYGVKVHHEACLVALAAPGETMELWGK